MRAEAGLGRPGYQSSALLQAQGLLQVVLQEALVGLGSATRAVGVAEGGPLSHDLAQGLRARWRALAVAELVQRCCDMADGHIVAQTLHQSILAGRGAGGEKGKGSELHGKERGGWMADKLGLEIYAS